MRVVFGDDDGKFTSTILDALCKLDESPWNDIRGKQLTDRGLAVRLRGYGIKPKPVRIGDRVARGYRREDFIELSLLESALQALQRYARRVPCGTT
jgi:hypothetical protein